MKRHRFPPGSEPPSFTGNLCEAYEVKCSARGGQGLCPGFREYDPEIMEGEKSDATIWCTCECHRKRTRPKHTTTAHKAVSPSGSVLVLRSSKTLQFECETSPPPAHVLRIALSGLVDHDGVLGRTRVCGVSTVPASAFTLLPAARKQ